MNEICQLFGSRVRELRKEKEMSQEELAFKASISPAHLGQIERAQKSPTLNTISEIAKGLNVPITALFEYDTPPSQPVKPTSMTEKIDIQLSDMSEFQKQEILRLIRLVKNFYKNE